MDYRRISGRQIKRQHSSCRKESFPLSTKAHAWPQAPSVPTPKHLSHRRASERAPGPPSLRSPLSIPTGHSLPLPSRYLHHSPVLLPFLLSLVLPQPVCSRSLKHTSNSSLDHTMDQPFQGFLPHTPLHKIRQMTASMEQQLHLNSELWLSILIETTVLRKMNF